MKSWIFFILIFAIGCVGGESEVDDDYMARTPRLEVSPVVINAVNLPSDKIYKTGEVLTFTVEYSDIVMVEVAPQLSLKFANQTKMATYKMGSGTSSLTFEYIVHVSDFSQIGTTVDRIDGGLLKDVNGVAIAAELKSTTNQNVLINSFVPSLLALDISQSGIYTRVSNNIITIEVDYDNSVSVTGTPTIDITIGKKTTVAQYVSGSGSNKLLFRYTVTGYDLALSPVVISKEIKLNGGSINSHYGVSAGLEFDGESSNKAYVSFPNLIAWYDGQDTSTMFTDPACTNHTTIIDNKVGCFLDKSGRGNHTYQATEGHKPELRSNRINGHTGIYFDANNDILSALDNPDFDESQKLTFFVIYRSGVVDTQPRAIISKRLKSDDTSFSLFQYTSNRMFLDIYNTPNRTSLSETLVANRVYVIALQFDGVRTGPNRTYLYQDGVRTILNSNFDRTRTSGGGLHLGSLNPGYGLSLGGDIGEVIIYRSALDLVNEFSEVNDYIKSKWGI